MWTYEQLTGALKNAAGAVVTHGYSGRDDGDPSTLDGKNNPLMQMDKANGPIPVGRWRIVGPPVDTEKHGPYVLRLEPMPGTETFGRSGFLVHGDSVVKPGMASLGCPSIGRPYREMMWKSGDHELLVVS